MMMIDNYQDKMYDQELEQLIIGSLLSSKSCHDEVLSRLHSDDFSNTSYQILYNAICRLYTSSKQIDVLTVISDLKENKEYTDLLRSTAVEATVHSTPFSISSHIDYVVNYSLKRKLAMSTIQWSQAAMNPTLTALEQFRAIKLELESIEQRLTKKSNLTMKDIYLSAVKRFEQNRVNGQILGYSTGINKIDHNTNGFGKGQLIVIAAGPGEGKSTLALQIAYHVAAQNGTVMYISLEMSKDELVAKLMSSEMQIPVSEIMKGNLNPDLIAKSEIPDNPMQIIDDTSNRFDEIYMSIKMQATTNDVKMVVIDYLQLMTGNTKVNKVLEIAEMTMKLKSLSRELQIPIVILSQVNRDKKRNDYFLSDLRDSGSIEQDADTVFFVFRPIRHNLNEYAPLQLSECNDETAIIKIEKCRIGNPGAFEVKFIGEYSKFENISDNQPSHVTTFSLNNNLPF